ncbi:MAG: fumarylacetoacetate hydrolase, partial [Hyphomicrobiaceae bacterium]
MRDEMSVPATLPEDGAVGVLAGRIWRPKLEGPSIVSVREDGVYDITADAPTMRDLAEAENAVNIIQDAPGERIGNLADILANTPEASRN